MNSDVVRELEFDALLGEVARPLTHEFNNFLNSLLLQFAVMEHEGQETVRSRLNTLRKEAKLVASQIREWQHMRREASDRSEAVDLNATLRELLTSFEGGTAVIKTSFSTEPALVHASAVELKRLCAMILRDAVAALSLQTSGWARIQTLVSAKEVALIVQDNREDVSTDDVGTWFDARGNGRSGHELQRAAAYGLVRRLRGTIQAVKGASDELVIRVTLPTGESASSR